MSGLSLIVTDDKQRKLYAPLQCQAIQRVSSARIHYVCGSMRTGSLTIHPVVGFIPVRHIPQNNSPTAPNNSQIRRKS